VALVALLTGGLWLARATGLAAVVANVPHQIYHQTTVDILPTTTDQVLQSLALAAVAVAAITLTVPAFSIRPDRFERPPQQEVTASAR
jgi:hypothetical protein